MEVANRFRRGSLEVVGSLFEHDMSVKMIWAIWIISALSLLISLWVNIHSDERGGIYLRASCILYLSMAMKITGNVARAIRVAMGGIIAILTVSGLSYDWNNFPLFFASGTSLLHMVACIMTYPGGHTITISGLRKTVFILLGLFASCVAIAVSLYADLPTWTVQQSIAFFMVGAPTMALANGIPKTTSHQTVGCFALLGPAAAAMYSFGDLTNAAPWIVSVTCMFISVTSALICVTSFTAWQEASRNMIQYSISSKVSAIIILVLFTFGNIACINGTVESSEAANCYVSKVNDVNATNFDDNVTSGDLLNFYTGDCIKRYSCVLSGKEAQLNKETEEIIPSMVLNFAKGAVACLLVYEVSSDRDETVAWAAATILGMVSVLWLATEGRGRCMEGSAEGCEPDRSYGFMAGLAICSVAIFLCAVRTVYCGIFLEWIKDQERLRIASVINDRSVESSNAWNKLCSRFRKKAREWETMTAIASALMLVCLIASSYTTVSVGGMQGDCGGMDKGFLKEVMVTRSAQLEIYWLHTCWIVSAAIVIISIITIIAVEESPAVAIALVSAFLVGASRIHYACLIGHLNSRITVSGMTFQYVVYMNSYIIAMISVIIGLAWNMHLVIRKKENYQMCQLSETPAAPSNHLGISDEELTAMGREMLGVLKPVIIFEVCDECYSQYDYEVFHMLIENNLIKPFLAAELVVNLYDDQLVIRADKLAWRVMGRCDLACGVYQIPNGAEGLIQIARACASGSGQFRPLAQGERSRRLE